MSASWQRLEREPVARDVSQPSAVSEALAHLADLAPVLIWVSDSDGACKYFNETWLKFTGLTLSQASGWGWLDFVHPADAARWAAERAKYTDHSRKRMPFRVEYRLRRADGQYRWIDAQGAPRFNVAGDFLGYVGCGWTAERIARVGADLPYRVRAGMHGHLRSRSFAAPQRAAGLPAIPDRAGSGQQCGQA